MPYPCCAKCGHTSFASTINMFLQRCMVVYCSSCGAVAGVVPDIRELTETVNRIQRATK